MFAARWNTVRTLLCIAARSIYAHRGHRRCPRPVLNATYRLKQGTHRHTAVTPAIHHIHGCVVLGLFSICIHSDPAKCMSQCLWQRRAGSTESPLHCLCVDVTTYHLSSNTKESHPLKISCCLIQSDDCTSMYAHRNATKACAEFLKLWVGER